MTSFAPVATLASLRTSAARPSVRGWALAVVVYFLAVFHRSSLGVAGLLAEQRFGITAGQLSVFVMLQIGVYAVMQVPTGVLVDRYGPRRLLVVASLLMGLGQILFALAPSYPSALVARALLGCGDAMTFVSVLRFVAARFSARRYPALVALTSLIGMLGNVFATRPLAQSLARFGWTTSFAIAGALSLVAAVAVWTLLDDRAAVPRRLRNSAEVRRGLRAATKRVAASWSLPATRMGFWVHFASMSTATAFGVLWGLPYLVDGAGFSSGAASVLLMAGVLCSAAVGPAFGWFIGRRPAMRVVLALVVCGVTIVGWLVTALLLGDTPPHGYIAALYIFTMFGGPASMVSFAVARDYNSARILGTASGVVNVGGFVATVIIAVGFGETVNLLGGTSAHNLRLALLVPIVVQLGGTLRIVVWDRRVRAYILARQRVGQPVPVPVVRRYWWDLRDLPDGAIQESLAS
jgi:predicted MFS family arabinose efflux permease